MTPARLSDTARGDPKDGFFSEIERMFSNASGHGSVYMTQKRVTLIDGAPLKSDNPTQQGQRTDAILFRASNLHKVDKLKASVIVKPEELADFFVRYTACCKANMTALKKRDRSKQKKNRSKKKKVATV